MSNEIEDNRAAFFKEIEKEHKRGKILWGLLIVAVGSIFLAKELGEEIPVWLFNWKMLVIGIGLVTVLKSLFRSGWGYFLILLGGGFLALDLYPELEIKKLLLPIGIILVGLVVIFKPRRPAHHRHWKKWANHNKAGKGVFQYEYRCQEEAEVSSEDRTDFYAYMSGVKKSVVSKNYKGGTIRTRFGGVELNLSQADFEGEVVLEIDQLFGGLELIVPAHWEIRPELATGFSSIEDNRTMQSVPSGENPKVLILRGSNVFAGIEIKNY